MSSLNLPRSLQACFSPISQFLGGGREAPSSEDSDDEAVMELAQRTKRKMKRAELAGRDDISSDADEDFR